MYILKGVSSWLPFEIIKIDKSFLYNISTFQHAKILPKYGRICDWLCKSIPQIALSYDLNWFLLIWSAFVKEYLCHILIASVLTVIENISLVMKVEKYGLIFYFFCFMTIN